MLASSSAPIVASQIFMQLVASMSRVEGSFRVTKAARLQVKKYNNLKLKILVIVSVLCFATNLSTIAAAGAVRRRHSPDGGIQWLHMKHWMCSIGRCALHHTNRFALQSKLPAIQLHFSSSSILLLVTTHNRS